MPIVHDPRSGQFTSTAGGSRGFRQVSAREAVQGGTARSQVAKSAQSRQASEAVSTYKTSRASGLGKGQAMEATISALARSGVSGSAARALALKAMKAHGEKPGAD